MIFFFFSIFECAILFRIILGWLVLASLFFYMDNFSFVFCLCLDKIFPLMFVTFLVFIFLPLMQFLSFYKKRKEKIF